MNNQEVSRQIQKLKALFNRTSEVSAQEVEIQAHWAKYLCVLSAGLLENGLYELYADFCRRAASPPVVGFANRFLSRIQNPKTGKFMEVASSFKNAWGEELKSFVENEGRKEAIDAIMAHRHRIAHGKDSDITIVRLKVYLGKAIDVLEFIERQCQ